MLFRLQSTCGNMPECTLLGPRFCRPRLVERVYFDFPCMTSSLTIVSTCSDFHSALSGWHRAAGSEQLSRSTHCVAPKEDSCFGPQLSGAVPVPSSTIYRRGSEGPLQTRPPQHAGLCQEEETRPTGSFQWLLAVLSSGFNWKTASAAEDLECFAC